MSAARGAVLYEGPSRLDGAPIVVVATGLDRPSANAKTGAMVQIWILRADLHPVDAVHSGDDSAICGDCPLRPLLARDTGGPMCYVNKGKAPAGIYKAYRAGKYPRMTARQVKRRADKLGRPIRFGAYGDPSAAPLELWQALDDGKRHTGYSHQWRRFRGLRRLTMASADSLGDAREAWRRGWRTFRVIRNVSELQPNEILCPASAEAGKRTTCASCGLCNGSTGPNDRRKSIAIVDHGPTAKRRPNVDLIPTP